MQVVDEFKTRHSTITQSINETYNIGNKLLQYMEKQVIIDFLIQGKIKDLEAQYPDLVKKAMRLVGFEMYYDLKVMETDEPLDPHNPWYYILMEKQQRLQSGIQEELSKHRVKRELNPNLPQVEEDTEMKEAKKAVQEELSNATESEIEEAERMEGS